MGDSRTKGVVQKWKGKAKGLLSLVAEGKSLRSWQIRIFLCIYVAYAACYVGKQSFNSLVRQIVDDSSTAIGMEEAGVIGSATAFGYTAGKVAATLLLDSLPIRVLFPSVVIGVAFTNLAFAFSTSLPAFVLLWGINGFLQGLAWLLRVPHMLDCYIPTGTNRGQQPCAKLLTVWFSPDERGRWWGAVATCSTLSSGMSQILFPLACTLLATSGLGWRTAMAAASLLPFLSACLVLVWLYDTPEDAGLRSPSAVDLTAPLRKSKKQEMLPMGQRLMIVITSYELILLSAASLLVYIVRTGINNWLAIFLTDVKQYPAVLAGSTLFWFEIGGACGSAFAGWMTDRVFKGKRAPGMAIYAGGAVGVLFALYLSSAPSVYSGLVFLFGWAIYGPQAFLGMMVAEQSDRRAVGTAVGLNGLMSGMGAMVAGYPISLLVTGYGWSAVFGLFGLCLIGTVMLLLPLWNKEAPGAEGEKNV